MPCFAHRDDNYNSTNHKETCDGSFKYNGQFQ